MLVIVAGGVIGASLSFGFLGSRSGAPVDMVGMVTGRIIDAQTGFSVTAAQVHIASLDRAGRLSQRNGRYLFKNVPAGTHTMTVARIGYRTTEVQITVGGGQTLEQDFFVPQGPVTVTPLILRKQDGRFVEVMEELESAISPTERFQPVEVRVIRER